jgi:WhiB family transcriptional regulator, redox-sensing transcriptional regulator
MTFICLTFLQFLESMSKFRVENSIALPRPRRYRTWSKTTRGFTGLEQPCEELHKEDAMATTTLTVTTEWRELAACRDSEPSLFFPIGSTGPAVDQIEAAKVICAACSVQDDCLQYALESNQESGVWGGYAEDERRRLRKRWLAERRRRAM